MKYKASPSRQTNINQKFNEIDTNNTKRIVFSKTTDGWNKPNKYN